jgi:outer membrane immunogenic protein
MKKTIKLNLLLLITSFGFAQGNLTKGTTQLNAGFGFSDWGIPVYVGIDHGIGHNITLGGEISYRSYNPNNYNYNNNNFKYNNRLIGITTNANYHFNELLNIDKEWDIYAGANLGYYIWDNNYKYVGPDGDKEYYKNYNHNYAGTSGIGIGIQTGARYFFTNKFGVNLELGAGTVFGGKFGITYKFNGGSSKKASKNKKKRK